MKSTRALMADHEIILRALRVLDIVADDIAHGQDVSRPDIDALLRFLREFADGYHHVKEEAILLPVLMQAGMSLRDGPLQVMTYEHERMRALAAAMRDAIEKNNKADFVLYAWRYITLLKNHIEKENSAFFDQAEQILDDDDDQQITEAFEHFARITVGLKTLNRLSESLQTLGAKYSNGVAAAIVAA